MRMSKMLGRRIKEDPKDAKTISHKYLVRGGYIRPVSAGMSLSGRSFCGSGTAMTSP